MVLKEEFFPLMGEIKGYISTLTFAGKGIFYGSCNKKTTLFWRWLSIEKPLLQIFLFVRTPGVWQSSFCHPACAENWKLHECCEYLIQGMWTVPCLKILFSVFDHRVGTQAVRSASEWLLCWSWQTPKQTNQEWILCIMLRWYMHFVTLCSGGFIHISKNLLKSVF